MYLKKDNVCPFLKHLVSQELVNEIFGFCNDIHNSKIQLINEQVQHRFGSENSALIDRVVENITCVDRVNGLQSELSTNYRREKYFKTHFNFVEPQRIPIEKLKEEDPQSYYWYLPIKETMKRLLKDNSLRKYIINQPIFCKQQVIRRARMRLILTNPQPLFLYCNWQKQNLYWYICHLKNNVYNLAKLKKVACFCISLESFFLYIKKWVSFLKEYDLLEKTLLYKLFTSVFRILSINHFWPEVCYVEWTSPQDLSLFECTLMPSPSTVP